MEGAGFADRQRRWIYSEECLSRNTEFLSFGISDDPDDFAQLVHLWRACGAQYDSHYDGQGRIMEPIDVFDKYEAVDNGVIPMIFDYFSGERVGDIINR